MEADKLALDYKEDLFFKYYCGSEHHDAFRFRKFLIENITHLDMTDARISNTELTTLSKTDKRIIMDTLITKDGYQVDMEMQNTILNSFLSKRFQYYACKSIVIQLADGEKDYGKLKEFYLIIFINEDNIHLINHGTLRYEDGKQMRDCVIHIYYVNLKAINKIARQRKLSEFEAVIYLMANNTVENIEYEEKEGMVQYMERSYEMFKADGALIRELLEEREKEFFHAMELNETRQEGEEKGKRYGMVNLLNTLIKMKYGEDAEKWLSQCNEQEFIQILALVNDNVPYESLIKLYMKD